MHNKRTQGQTLRVFAVAVVVGLIAIAIAGLLPAARRAFSGEQSGPSVASIEQKRPAPDPTPNAVLFAENSDQLPADALEKLARIASGLRGESRSIIITAQVESPDSLNPEMALARSRAAAIRQVLQLDGVDLGLVLTQITQVGIGRGVPHKRNRLEIVEQSRVAVKSAKSSHMPKQ